MYYKHTILQVKKTDLVKEDVEELELVSGIERAEFSCVCPFLFLPPLSLILPGI